MIGRESSLRLQSRNKKKIKMFSCCMERGIEEAAAISMTTNS